MKPYYQDDLVTLYWGDCLDVLWRLDQQFDLCVTSPPYNLGSGPWEQAGHWKRGQSSGGNSKWTSGASGGVGVDYAASNDSMDHSEYVTWQQQVLNTVWGHLADDGAIYYNHKPRVVGTRTWTPLELIGDLPLRQIVTWARSGGMNATPTAYVPSYEWIMVIAKEAWRLRDRSASGATDVWRMHQESRSEHPAPFPVALPTQAIQTSGARFVLDPFVGSGTTALAARNLGVRCVGIDQSAEYLDMAIARLQQQAFDFGDWDGAA